MGIGQFLSGLYWPCEPGVVGVELELLHAHGNRLTKALRAIPARVVIRPLARWLLHAVKSSGSGHGGRTGRVRAGGVSVQDPDSRFSGAKWRYVLPKSMMIESICRLGMDLRFSHCSDTR